MTAAFDTPIFEQTRRPFVRNQIGAQRSLPRYQLFSVFKVIRCRGQIEQSDGGTKRVPNTKAKKTPRRIEGLDRPEVGRAIGAGTLCAWSASAADQVLNFLTQST